MPFAGEFCMPREEDKVKEKLQRILTIKTLNPGWACSLSEADRKEQEGGGSSEMCLQSHRPSTRKRHTYYMLTAKRNLWEENA